MKNELKKYEKPSIEVMDIQWSECIAASYTPLNRPFNIYLSPGKVNDTYEYFTDPRIGGGGRGTWDTTGF